MSFTNMTAAIDEWYLFDSAGLKWQDQKKKKEINPFLRLRANMHSKRQGYTVNCYRSGEITGARFCTGLEGTFPIAKNGTRETDQLTQAARTKIRRAIQNAPMDFKCFMTVTFDPKHSELDQNGNIEQKWAKEKFKTFLNSIAHSCNRRAILAKDDKRKLGYVWVAELQENGNIHFHMLLNQRLPIKWLTNLWDQATNSIHVKSVNNANHAGNYIRKYFTKGQNTIKGNRYGISQNLRETMQPKKESTDDPKKAAAIKELIQAMKEDIERNGGKVIDSGFFIPQPTRSVPYKKNGKIKHTKAVSGQLGPLIIEGIREIIDPIPF